MKHQLDNGLTVLVQSCRFAPVVALQAWVHVGSADESESEQGLAHLIEHMLFKGTPTRGVGDIAREVESAGGDIDAWKVGGKYTLNNFSVFGQYEDSSEDDNDAAAEGLKVWHVGGTYTMGNNTLYGAYGQGTVEFQGPGSDDEDYTTWSIGGIHKMSKRTFIYAAYTAADCDAAMSDIYENGLDVSVCSGVDDNGGDNKAGTIGMKHKF